MADVVTMLALSPTMDEGTLVEWLKDEGDQVEEGEVLAEVETDKATMEMESFFAGTLLKRLVDTGDSVAVGAPIAVIGEEGEDIDEVLQDLGDQGGEQAAPDKKEPAAAEQAEEAGAAEETDEAETQEAQEAPEAETPSQAQPTDGRIKASPVARRIAAEKGIELSSIEGSGPAGRIIKRDVEEAQQRRPEAPAAAPTPAAGELAGQKVELSQMRKTIARRLQEVWQSTPHFALTVDIDMARAMEQRAQINEELAAADIDAKVSVNDLIVKACALALEEYPAMNVAYQGDHLVQYDDIHIGVAVAVEAGLITPTIDNANQKGLRRISEEARQLAQRARDKKLTPEEYTGGTFTVSNLGMYGIDHFMAVINPPQAGILACGTVDQVPVVEDGELTVGTRMKVTLSCDHRAVDGAQGAEFLNHVKRYLENPVLLMV